MDNIIKILRDVVIEARTASQDLEYDDTLINSFEFIENMTNTAIKNLEAQIGDTDATGT